ncbi:MAG: ICE-like protease [Myxococcales bacterium]|nr:ICE-like protease [Myxococcales bacterium]
MKWLVALLVCLPLTAAAETRRVAVVVGNNAGGADETPLHFAETDAGKLARVLAELGGIEPENLYLLQGKGLAALTETFTVAKRRVAELQRDPANRVILVFYFSGHSDGEALELGRDRLSFSDLRHWLGSTGAEVRLALVDSCKSGALLAVKGGKQGPAFQIRLSDELSSNGEALLTSSAADEVALESKEIGGSFFTHHFVSGLRGAADSSGDGIVTLTEAYQYAYAHTISTTGATVIGPQHPAYDYRLSGQGELVLTELTKPTAMLELPTGFQRVLVVELARDQVIAELTSDARTVIAVQPGRYGVRAWRGGVVSAGRVSVAANEKRGVRWEELATIGAVETRSKGATPSPSIELEPSAALTRLFVGGGGAEGVANNLGLVPSVRLGVQVPQGLTFAIVGGSLRHASFRETSSSLLVGYRAHIERGALRATAGGEAGGGLVVQTATQGASAYSGALVISPCAGLSVTISGRFSLALEAAVSTTVLERDGKTVIVALPAGWFGAVIAL